MAKHGGNRIDEPSEDFGAVDWIDQTAVNKERERRVRVWLHLRRE
jgi:hypothetical protein